jgi:hypothetical protein
MSDRAHPDWDSRLRGFDNEPARIARELAAEYGGPREARVLGLERPTTPEKAAYANAVMIRYQDLNDVNKALRMGGHPSDMIPAVLAVAGAYQVPGQRALLGVIAAYQGFGSVPVHIRRRDGEGAAGALREHPGRTVELPRASLVERRESAPGGAAANRTDRIGS